MDFELYRHHVVMAKHPLDRQEEDRLLRQAGSADWALQVRALLVGHFNHLELVQGLVIDPAYLLEKLDAAHDNNLALDELNRQEYFRLKSAVARRTPMLGIEGVT